MLWVDAICINQDDDDERTDQVRLMREIYRQAKHVFVWMGADIEGMEEGISLMHRVKQCEHQGVGYLEGLIELCGSKFRKGGWDALTELMKRAWWTRVWIIQEAVVGGDVVVLCGRQKFEWGLLQALGDSIQVLRMVTWSLLRHDRGFYCSEFLHVSTRLPFICALKGQQPVDAQSLRFLLCGVRASEATDPRDKVFAMLGLLQDNMRLCEIDYRKSVGRVYVEAAAGILRATGTLNFLSWTHNVADRGGYLTRPEGLPSWTPSWIASQNQLLELQYSDELTSSKDRLLTDQEIVKGQPSSIPQAEDCIYAATQRSRAVAACDVERGILSVLGCIVDILEDVSPPTSNGPFFPTDGPAAYWIRTVLATKLGIPIVASTQEPGSDSDSDSDDEASISCQISPTFWRILLADQWQGVRFGKEVSIPGVGSIPPKSIDELFKMRRAATSLENSVAYRWRHLFISRKTVGLVPPVARRGDVILAIFGCDVLYLVRKCENGYRFLGEW